jgi:hypothetical protein
VGVPRDQKTRNVFEDEDDWGGIQGRGQDFVVGVGISTDQPVITPNTRARTRTRTTTTTT